MSDAHLPKWLERRYSILWKAFNDTKFKMEDAVKILEEKIKDSKDQVPVILSELRKNGWLEVELDPEDARKRLYKLKGREEIISEILSVKNNKLTRREIETLLKKAGYDMG